MKNDEDKKMIIWRIMANDEDKKKDSVEDHEIDDFFEKINISRHLSVWLQKCHNLNLVKKFDPKPLSHWLLVRQTSRATLPNKPNGQRATFD